MDLAMTVNIATIVILMITIVTVFTGVTYAVATARKGAVCATGIGGGIGVERSVVALLTGIDATVSTE